MRMRFDLPAALEAHATLLGVQTAKGTGADMGFLSKIKASWEDGLADDVPIDSRRVNAFTKVFGILCIIVSGAMIAALVLGLVALAHQMAAGVVFYEGSLAMMAYVALYVMLVLLASVHLLLGLNIIRNRRKYAARTILVLMAVTGVALFLDILVFGIDTASLVLTATLLGQFAISSYLDPSLAQERRLDAQLRTMEDRKQLEEGTLGRDPSGKGYITLNFFNCFWIFLVCCILGDFLEVAFVLVKDGHFMHRSGMLFGAFSPIYGMGALLMTMALNRFYNKNLVPIFLVSAVIGGAFEFAVSWFWETAFGVVCWDYSGTFLNIGGRTNLFYMCMWGMLGTVWIKLMLPRLLALINCIPWKSRYTITVVVAAFMLVNAVMTVQAIDCWTKRAAGNEPQSAVELFYNENFPDPFMQTHFETMTVTQQHG